MSLFKLLLLIYFQIICGKTVDITFNNVIFHGYSTFTPKFKPTILAGTSLKDYLPHKDFDTIEFIDQNIPVLYKNSIADIDELKELILESSNVQEIIPGAFKNLPHLNRLYLKGNKIERIENGVFNNLPIHSLDLSYNKIKNIYSQAFDDMQHLYYINLAYNNISKWDPNWFKNTPELTTIFMKNNFIEELPEHSFKNLKINPFKIRDLHLVFSNNKISKIDSNAFIDLKKISQLALGNNLLKSFDKKILGNTVVNDLRLNNNSIECFEDKDFDTLFKGPSVYVEFNPFDCDCVKNMQKWAKNHSNKNLGINDIKCGEDDEDEDGPRVIDIEEMTFGYPGSVNRITLVLPKN